MRGSLVVGALVVASGCAGSDADPAAGDRADTVPFDSRVPATLTDLAGNPPSDLAPGMLRDLIERQLTSPDGLSLGGSVAVQVAFGTPPLEARLEVPVPDDGFDAQAGGGAECVGLTAGSPAGRIAVTSSGAGEGDMEAAQVVIGGPLIGGQLHPASLVFALRGQTAGGGPIEVRLAADLRSGTFTGRDAEGDLMTGRFDCIAAGAVTSTVDVGSRGLRSIAVTVDITGGGVGTRWTLSGEGATLPAGAFCSGVVGFDEPYAVRLDDSAGAVSDGLISVDLVTDVPAARRETTAGTVAFVAAGDTYELSDASISISSDGLGGVFQGATAGGDEVLGTWLCA